MCLNITMPSINLMSFNNLCNVGDELSSYLIEKITHCNINHVDSITSNKLVAIGSIINLESLVYHSIFWGTGILYESHIKILSNWYLSMINNQSKSIQCRKTIDLSNKTKFCALRGPMTANGLKVIGIDSSRLNNTFGDPGILLPYVYQPTDSDNYYDLGLIFHHSQPQNEVIRLIEEKFSNKVKFISVKRKGYRECEQFINELCSCKKIASAALHGIILAQAYGIPALFIQNLLSPVANHCLFKFNDYFLGTDQEPQIPYKFDDYEQAIHELLRMDFPTPPVLKTQCQRLLDAFPYQEHLKLKTVF